MPSGEASFPGRAGELAPPHREAVERLHQWLEDRAGELVRFAQELVRIPSVKEDGGSSGAGVPPAAEHPFGENISRALEAVFRAGESAGMRVRRFPGYAGHVEIGAGPELIGVLTHVDVVPPGNDWTVDPFGAEIRQGRLYGRGAVDDKGPTAAAFFALRALHELRLPMQRRIRLIVGGDEESGWACMDHYFRHEEQPTFGFSPDGYFPLVHAEKGILTLELTMPWPREGGFLVLESVQGGTRPNVVPDRARARVGVPRGQEQVWAERLQEAFTDMASPGSVTMAPGDGTLEVVATGRAWHAMEPERGRNAIWSLVGVLSRYHSEMGSQGVILRFLSQRLNDTDGRGWGIACADDVSGPLTVNTGRIWAGEGALKVVLNIRYPVTRNKDGIVATIAEQLEAVGGQVTELDHKAPLYVPVDDPFIRTLQAVFHEHTGLDPKPIAIGGGTYARCLRKGVAYGPVFPGQPELAHQPDEYIELETLFRCARIYAQALYELANPGARR